MSDQINQTFIDSIKHLPKDLLITLLEDLQSRKPSLIKQINKLHHKLTTPDYYDIHVSTTQNTFINS